MDCRPRDSLFCMMSNSLIEESMRRWRSGQSAGELGQYAMREWGAQAHFFLLHTAKPGILAQWRSGVLQRLAKSLRGLVRKEPRSVSERLEAHPKASDMTRVGGVGTVVAMTNFPAVKRNPDAEGP